MTQTKLNTWLMVSGIGLKIKHEGTLTEKQPDDDQPIRDYPQTAKEKQMERGQRAE